MILGITRKVIDINAHIEDLKYRIIVENGVSIANISFSNLGYGDITAIRFEAKGYNSFGDAVLINGNENFYLSIQSIMIKKNEKAENIRIELPSSIIARMDLKEFQINYASGAVITYAGENRFAYDLDEIINGDQLNALHRFYSGQAKYKAQEYSQGWVCSCGRFNQTEVEMCSLCNKSKTETLHIFADDNLNKLVEKYRNIHNEEVQKQEEYIERKEKERKKRNIIVAAILVVCIILAFPIGRFIVMSRRATFDDVSQMRVLLQGTYTHQDDYGMVCTITICGDKLKYEIDSPHYDDSGSWTTIYEWLPEEGKIRTYEDIIVTNHLHLRKDGELYVREE